MAVMPLELLPRGDREAELLIHCARASIEPSRADRISELAAGEFNWDRLLTLAERNGLRPLLYWHLSRLCPSIVPAGTFQFLRDYFQKNSAFSLLLTGELLQVIGALQADGIDAVPFKGPAIAVRLYGHVALRQFCDIDILVREADVWRAGQILEKRGFAPQFVIPEEWRATYLRQEYAQLYRRDAGRTLVELHWGIAPEHFATEFDSDTMWEQLQPMTLQGTSVRIPCAEDLLLMLCIHGSRHNWDKLEGVASFAELVRGSQPIEWDRVWQKAGQMRCRRMLTLALMLARGLFEVPMPSRAAALSRSPALRTLAGRFARDLCADEAPPRTLGRQAARHLRVKDSYADQVRYCARLALTPTPDDWAAVRLHKRLSFGYSLVRAVRIARRRFNQHQHMAGAQ